MFDQSFSANNLRKITEIENRRGSNRSLEFFQRVYDATEELKDCIRAAKQFRASHRHTYSAADQAIFDALKEDRESARKVRDTELLSCLSEVSNEISTKSFRIEIQKTPGPKGKPVYVVPDNPKDRYANCYYAIKQIARNISRIYKVKQANRTNIVTQLCDTLNDGFPYHVLKLDVQEFYESIDHKLLLSKLRSDQLLSATTLRLIERLLWDYAQKAGTLGRGLPRGVGVSAVLSELFMRDFDKHVSALNDVAYYARYVDDIVVLFAPTKGATTDKYRERIVEQLRQKRLLVNGAKTTESPSDKNGWSLTYLGYTFKYKDSTKCDILMSNEKFERYQRRLDASFIRYHRQRANNSKKAYRLLVKRVQYLTSNTQLTHSKQNAFVGIFFSNPHLSEYSQLTRLDDRLRQRVASLTHSPKLMSKLNLFSFEQGYKEQIFRRFHRDGEFASITKAWKYGQ